MDSLTTPAPAKINLILSVAAPEPADGAKAGFHRIASWFAGISLRDDVVLQHAAPGEQGAFEVTWAEDAPRPSPIDWPVEKDLGFRAHRLMEQTLGRPLPVRIHIRKRIPVGGGLGGGSSDAAAVMLGLNRFFELGLAPAQLIPLAMQLGSDVAYFVNAADGGLPPAIVTGFGESIEPAPSVSGSVLLIIPPFGCPTGPVYRSYDQLLKQRAEAEPTRRVAIANEELLHKRCRKIMLALEKGESVPSELLFNDLAPAAFGVEPRLGRLVTALSNTLRVPVHVTGSGSCLFVLPPHGKAERLIERTRTALAVAEPGAVALLCELLA